MHVQSIGYGVLRHETKNDDQFIIASVKGGPFGKFRWIIKIQIVVNVTGQRVRGTEA
jgi:hypothetical protein